MDEFEENLKQKSLRIIPADWRKQILIAAQTRTRNSSDARFAWREVIENLLTPSPKGWIGLSCVWMVLAMIHVTMAHSNESKGMGGESTPGMLAFGEQEKLLTESFEQTTRPETAPAVPKKPMTPRSELLFLSKRA